MRGQRKVYPKWQWRLVQIMGVIAVLIWGGGYYLSSKYGVNPDRKLTATELRQQQAQELARVTCDGDIQCAGSRSQGMAGLKCAPEIEKLAKYDVRWTDGITEPKMPNARWSERSDIVKRFGEQRIIEFHGDKIQMQNGFGAYRRVDYECDFDPLNDAVVAVRVYD